MAVINRDIIRDDALFSCLQHPERGVWNKEQFCERIDQWKAYLVNECDFRKGDLLLNGIVIADWNHFAVALAVAELGGINLKLHYVYTPELWHYSLAKYTKPKVMLLESWMEGEKGEIANFEEGRRHHERCGTFRVGSNDFDSFISDYDKPQSRPDPVVSPSDPIQLANAYGYKTDGLKVITHRHGEFYKEAKRNAEVLNMKDKVAVYMNNINHARSFQGFFLPALFAAKYHEFINTPDDPEWFRPDINEGFARVLGSNKQKILCAQNVPVLEHVLTRPEKLGDNLDVYLMFNKVNARIKRISKFMDNHRVNLLFGEEDTGAIIFKHGVYENTPEDNCIGEPLDDYYDMRFEDDGSCLVKAPHLDQWRVLGDYFIENEGSVHHKPWRHPLHDRVLEILGYDRFDVFTIYGQTFLNIWHWNGVGVEINEDQQSKLDELGLTGIHQLHWEAYRHSDERDWWALKMHYSMGYKYPVKTWEDYESERVKTEKITSRYRYDPLDFVGKV